MNSGGQPRNMESAVNMLLKAALAQHEEDPGSVTPRRQVAALPWEKRRGTLFVALVNSRETGRLAGQGRQPRTVRVRGRRSR